MLNFALLWWWSSIPSLGACSQDQTDRLALAFFKNDIDKDPFRVLSSWNDSTNHCEWQGVLCSKRHPGRVMIMVLQSNSFGGEIPSQIGNLFRLRNIDLSNNSFGGPIPSNLSRYSNLESLNFVDNRLVGGIYSNLGSLPRLKKLALAKNGLVGPIPPSIGNLLLLQHLTLTENAFRGEIPEELSRLESFPSDIGTTLPFLYYLGGLNNMFTGIIPSSLTNTTSLRGLYLANNNFHGPIPKNLGRLKGLYVIALGLNRLQDDLSFISSLANCSNLGILSVDANSIHGSLPTSISNLSTSIKQISMSNNLIHGTIPSAFGNLFNLSYLSLKNNSLTDRLPDSIGALYNLRLLSLSRNMFTVERPPSIGNMTSLNRLFLQDNNFQGYIPQSLGNCKQIIELELSNNNLSGSIPVEIVGLYSLSILFNLAHNNLSGSLPYQVGSLRSLEELDLFYNRLTGLIPASISGCLRLARLHLETNSFHGQIPQALSLLQRLEVLDLSNNNFSSPIPGFLTEFSLLKYLNIGVFLNASVVSVSGNRELCGGVPTLKLPLCKLPSSNKSSTIKAIITFVVAISLLCLALLFLSIFYYRKKKQTRTTAWVSSSFKNQFMRISYDELLRATDRFLETNLIGKGRYGTVYMEILEGIAIVAVKVLNLTQRGAARSFVSGCQTLGTIRHRNLVKILSVCSSVDICGNDFKALIYKFMANGKYGIGHQVSTLGDAYSYGILLLEMFTGKRPTEEAFGHCLNLHSFVQMALPDRVMDIVDSRLWSEAGDRQQGMRIKDCIISIFEVGVECSIESPLDRMDMTEAIRKLYSIKASYEIKERTDVWGN
ncbi:hypothetical protein EUGRSUZ_G01169 [Eucalyptus grandis]|uniref:Uncharacterized protein n=2 Tax=Eucalyptus grandis TaxID=71139 RepID=A0ACC3K368_EUCGR|nr:hypothetical protein EUGRSUZ_G01169 [Eucalyptus grandis]